MAVDVPAGQLGRAIAAWLSRTSEDDELERLQHDQRSVAWRNEPDGMITFTARLPPLATGQLIARLQTHVMTNRPDAVSGNAWPSLAQQHADALSALIDGGGSMTTEVVLHVREDGATLDDGSPVPIGAVGSARECSADPMSALRICYRPWSTLRCSFAPLGSKHTCPLATSPPRAVSPRRR